MGTFASTEVYNAVLLCFCGSVVLCNYVFVALWFCFFMHCYTPMGQLQNEPLMVLLNYGRRNEYCRTQFYGWIKIRTDILRQMNVK